MTNLVSKTARILIVEDDEDDFILTSDHLHQLDKYSFSIDWVTNRNDALAELEQNQHDICLMDYRLGQHTGIDVLNEAKKRGSNVPIIMLTGQSDDELDQAALDAGAVDYLVKGDISNARFARAIRYAIARQELQHARQENIDAATKNQSKDRFLAHLSHELRTPLTSVLGYTELLLNSDKAKDAKKELSTILNNGKHLLSLLNDILDLSKISAGKLQLAPTPIVLSSFIADVLTLMQIPATEKGLALKFESSDKVPQVIDADITRLRQVLINLIFNAIKFTSEGEVVISIEYDALRSQDKIQFDVVDTGVGIPENKIHTIFQPFQQIEDMVSRKEQGAGLGLAICNELIRLMDGKISVSSKVGRGSCFSVVLPLSQKRQQDLHDLDFDISQVQEKVTFPALKGNVLVVDDIEDIRNLVGHFLKSFGLNVSYASNGKDGLDKACEANGNYDVIIMDIHMPVMDGREAIVKMREAQVDIPVFALTAANMKGVKEELQQLGFSDVIGKPAEQKELYSRLHPSLPLAETSLSESASTAVNEPNKKVLIVEDDADAAELVKMLLESINIESDIVHTLAECKQALFSEQQYFHVLIDKNLPDGDGFDLANSIKEISPNCQLTLLSGEEVEETELKKHNISNSLMKPINLEQLSNLF